ncbi:hypothetical protein ACQJBY_034260 [Aegilops geniculata]
MVPEQEVVEQERAVDSAEAQILAARVAAVTDRRESSPLTSKLSTGKMNPRAPEWNKRLKIVLRHRAEHRAQTMGKAACCKRCANAAEKLEPDSQSALFALKKNSWRWHLFLHSILFLLLLGKPWINARWSS